MMKAMFISERENELNKMSETGLLNYCEEHDIHPINAAKRAIVHYIATVELRRAENDEKMGNTFDQRKVAREQAAEKARQQRVAQQKKHK